MIMKWKQYFYYSVKN